MNQTLKQKKIDQWFAGWSTSLQRECLRSQPVLQRECLRSQPEISLAAGVPQIPTQKESKKII
jgi:hypothetical protein